MSGSLVLDKALILERLGGDEELFVEMAAMYVAEAENYCQAMAGAVSGGEAADIRREAHTIKGLLATFADDEGTAMALQIEAQARDGQLAGVPEQAIALQGRVRLLADVLTSHISA